MSFQTRTAFVFILRKHQIYKYKNNVWPPTDFYGAKTVKTFLKIHDFCDPQNNMTLMLFCGSQKSCIFKNVIEGMWISVILFIYSQRNINILN